MARTYNELSTELGREPTEEEVAEELDWDVDPVGDVKSAYPTPPAVTSHSPQKKAALR
jgi:RNA polymerase primary sigma factor